MPNGPPAVSAFSVASMGVTAPGSELYVLGFGDEVRLASWPFNKL